MEYKLFKLHLEDSFELLNMLSEFMGLFTHAFTHPLNG